MSKKLDIDTNLFLVEDHGQTFYLKLQGGPTTDWVYKIWDDHTNYIVKDKNENVIGSYATFPDLLRNVNELYKKEHKNAAKD